MKQPVRIIERIQRLKKRYHLLASEKKHLLTLINEAEVAEQVYNSNAIENSTLSLEETEKILLQIDLDRFINERELFEAKNLARVVEYINTKAIETEISMDIMLFLHKMLISNIRDDIAGRFRKDNELVRIGSHIAPPPAQLQELLQKMLAEYKYDDQKNMIERIARLHLTFEHTHPFCDGNGRIGRVINNYCLLREGYVPINIKFIDRAKYYAAFQEFDSTRSTKVMEGLVGLALSNSFHKRLAYLEEKKIILLSVYAKQKKISYSNLLNKAKRQTIEAFTERGKWKIGV